MTEPRAEAGPEQTHSAEYNRGWADGNAAALDACNPIIERLQAEAAAGPRDELRPDHAEGLVPEALHVEAAIEEALRASQKMTRTLAALAKASE